MPKPKKFDQKSGVRKLARDRVGAPPPAKIIVPKSARKPKHKKPAVAEED